jgi:monoamine oxidase
MPFASPSFTTFYNLLLVVVRILGLSTPVGLGLVNPHQAQFTSGIAIPTEQSHATSANDFQVLILGGGVAGAMAAETLHRRGIDNFKVIEARSSLGGRMKSFSFGAPGREYILELGADWIHGTQTNNGPSNPIYDLARKHNLSTQPNHYRGSMSTSPISDAVITDAVGFQRPTITPGPLTICRRSTPQSRISLL